MSFLQTFCRVHIFIKIKSPQFWSDILQSLANDLLLIVEQNFLSLADEQIGQASVWLAYKVGSESLSYTFLKLVCVNRVV